MTLEETGRGAEALQKIVELAAGLVWLAIIWRMLLPDYERARLLALLQLPIYAPPEPTPGQISAVHARALAITKEAADG
jgi:hypothetical protein